MSTAVLDASVPFAPTQVAVGLDFPTSLALDASGRLHVAESGLPFGGARPGGRIVRLGRDGRKEVVLDGLRQPVNGLTWHDGAFLIAEGGAPGRISRWRPGSARETILDGLPARGNYHTNMVVPGPDGWLYFSQGAMTNSGVVGLDAFQMAWLKKLPHPYDVPGLDIEVDGQVFCTDDPLAEAQPASARTTAFAPFGQTVSAGRRIAGRVPCTAAVMRCRPDGSDLELVAWGIRNAYGLGFLPDGRLLATDQGPDDRGSRPIGRAPDLLHVVEPGRWYGWPDFVGDRPVTDPAFRPERGAPPTFVLANHAALPPPTRAVLEFPINASATKFAVLPRDAPIWPGQVVVACFGDEKPVTAAPGGRVGRNLARVDPRDWSLTPLDGPAVQRPIDVLVAPGARSLLVLDFGHFEMLGGGGMEAVAGSGAVWTVPIA